MKDSEIALVVLAGLMLAGFIFKPIVVEDPALDESEVTYRW